MRSIFLGDLNRQHNSSVSVHEFQCVRTSFRDILFDSDSESPCTIPAGLYFVIPLSMYGELSPIKYTNLNREGHNQLWDDLIEHLWQLHGQ